MSSLSTRRRASPFRWAVWERLTRAGRRERPAPGRVLRPVRTTRPRPARATIADDGTRTEKGKGACLWLELDGIQVFSLPGDLLDKFTDGAAAAFTPPVGYAL